MPRIQLRCPTCNTRADAEVSQTEEQHLRTQGFLTRYCNRCRGQVRWVQQQAATSSFRGGPTASTPVPLQASVLVIDDDESILAILRKALSNEEMELDLANSARIAVQLLGRADYDLILSDVRMPEFDGKQLFQFIDQNLPEYRTKVIFLTGDTGNPDTLKFLKDSGCPYLSKPLDIPKLLELLRMKLAKKQETS